MKKIIPFMMIITLLLSSCQLESSDKKVEEIRGVWISCYDHIPANGKTETEYKSETDKMFETIAKCGFNTAFVHLRAFSDSFYKSKIFPYSSYIAEYEGADLLFDPFEVMLKSAKDNGISVHGWINPFRVSTKSDPSLIHSSNPAKKIIDSGNKSAEICILDNGIYYNPSCISNHKLVIDGVREILSKYDIDGIHIDDYFYPSTDKKIDSIQYTEYVNSGGVLPLDEWRVAGINAFVSALYSAVKSYGNDKIFSISPSADIEKNKNELYADCELWLSSNGYADIIIPQIYFGFEHEKYSFDSMLDKWSALPRHSDVELLCGIAAYKISTEDEYAGAGKKEWQNSIDILARQAILIRNNHSFNGFVVFSYSDLLRNNAANEIYNLTEIIKTEK